LSVECRCELLAEIIFKDASERAEQARDFLRCELVRKRDTDPVVMVVSVPADVTAALDDETRFSELGGDAFGQHRAGKTRSYDQEIKTFRHRMEVRNAEHSATVRQVHQGGCANIDKDCGRVENIGHRHLLDYRQKYFRPELYCSVSAPVGYWFSPLTKGLL